MYCRAGIKLHCRGRFKTCPHNKAKNKGKFSEYPIGFHWCFKEFWTVELKTRIHLIRKLPQGFVDTLVHLIPEVQSRLVLVIGKSFQPIFQLIVLKTIRLLFLFQK